MRGRTASSVLLVMRVPGTQTQCERVLVLQFQVDPHRAVLPLVVCVPETQTVPDNEPELENCPFQPPNCVRRVTTFQGFFLKVFFNATRTSVRMVVIFQLGLQRKKKWKCFLTVARGTAAE